MEPPDWQATDIACQLVRARSRFTLNLDNRKEIKQSRQPQEQSNDASELPLHTAAIFNTEAAGGTQHLSMFKRKAPELTGGAANSLVETICIPLPEASYFVALILSRSIC
jgi:hypothetical protein